MQLLSSHALSATHPQHSMSNIKLTEATCCAMQGDYSEFPRFGGNMSKHVYASFNKLDAFPFFNKSRTDSKSSVPYHNQALLLFSVYIACLLSQQWQVTRSPWLLEVPSEAKCCFSRRNLKKNKTVLLTAWSVHHVVLSWHQGLVIRVIGICHPEGSFPIKQAKMCKRLQILSKCCCSINKQTKQKKINEYRNLWNLTQWCMPEPPAGSGGTPPLPFGSSPAPGVGSHTQRKSQREHWWFGSSSSVMSWPADWRVPLSLLANINPWTPFLLPLLHSSLMAEVLVSTHK